MPGHFPSGCGLRAVRAIGARCGVIGSGVLVVVAACGGGAEEPEPRVLLAEMVFATAEAGNPEAEVEAAVVALDGTRRRVLTARAENVFTPTPSPDGRSVLFQEGARIRLLDLGSGEVRTVTPGLARTITPAWRPDGRAFAYAAQRSIFTLATDICARDRPDGAEVCLSPQDTLADNSPAWSPDGTRIVWTRQRNDSLDIWIMNADGSNQRVLIDDSAFDCCARWPPDGRTILFRSFRHGIPTIFLYDVASGATELLFGLPIAPVETNGAAWMPDGRTIVVSAPTPERTGTQLLAVDVATRSVRPITDGVFVNDFQPWARAP